MHPLYQLVKNIISKFTISCVPPYIITGKRYTSVTHARLRNNCSSLNNDLFRNHVCDNPLCDLCGVILVEHATIYLFRCIKYFDKIQVFNDTDRVFQPLTINFLGNGNWNTETNMGLFGAIYRYIHA